MNIKRNAAILIAASAVGALGIGESDDDATDVGPDADPNEPGHQDASDAGDGEVPDAQE